jgi:putative Holliday junction resolvase
MIGRLLGIDHGLARIGLAVSDANGIVARELMVLERASKKEDFAIINQLAKEHEVVALVVGIPYSTGDSTEGFTQADKVRNWIGYLQATTDLPIITWDESMSSDEAYLIGKQMGRQAYEPIDDLAARVILQSYLDALHDGLTTFPPRSSS